MITSRSNFEAANRWDVDSIHDNRHSRGDGVWFEGIAHARS